MKTKVQGVCKGLSPLMLYLALGLVGINIIGFDPIYTTLILNIAVIVYYFLHIRKEYKGESDDVWLNYEEVLRLVFLFVGVWLFGQITGSYLGTHVGSPNFDTYTKDMESAPKEVTLLLIYFIAPIAEEILYRGMVFRKFLKVLNPYTAIISQAVLFSLMHGTIVHYVGTFMLALFSAVVYYKTKSLKFSVLVHFFYNFASVFLMKMPVLTVLLKPPVFAAFDILLISLCLVEFHRSTKLTSQDGEINEEGTL